MMNRTLGEVDASSPCAVVRGGYIVGGQCHLCDKPTDGIKPSEFVKHLVRHHSPGTTHQTSMQ